MALRLYVSLFFIGVCICAQGQTCFPVVDPTTQKERDEDRRQILETELRSERDLLSGAQAAVTGGATPQRLAAVSRHAANVEELRRELASTASAPRTKGPVRVAQRAKVMAAFPTPDATSGQANFWNPYNRLPEHDLSLDVFPIVRKEMP